jgi:hypothetical protein
MAEISYPFAADSSGGGTKMVSQAQWQLMAKMMGGDRVDFQLTSTNYAGNALPFWATISNGQVSIQPGNAFVGGFYYQLTSSIALNITPNTGAVPRTDLVVIRADLAAGSVNLAIVTGQPAPSPVTPAPTKTPNGRWEMPLYTLSVPANNGTVTATSIISYQVPGNVAVPWNASVTAPLLPVGTTFIDMDSNTNDVQTEWFRGRDASLEVRDYGKSRLYTPTVANAKSQTPVGQATRTGRWRWIAPNTVFFSVNIYTVSEIDIASTEWHMGITLPVPACGKTGQIVSGHIYNGKMNGGLPNIIHVLGEIPSGGASSVLYLDYPSPNSTAAGYDGLGKLPAASELIISGVYEANKFNE